MPEDSKVSETSAMACIRCGTEFVPVVGMLGQRACVWVKTCASCTALENAEMEAREREELETTRRQEWERICPPLYAQTEPERLPPEVLSRVLAWNWSPKGLLLHGPSRAGKTRTMYQLLRRLVWEDRKVRAVMASEFKRGYAAAVASNRSDEWLREMSGCDALFIDDLGQIRMTDAAEEVLLEILELRSRYLRPTFVTTQYVGEELVEQFLRKQRGQAVLMRLREFSEAIAAGW